MSGMENKHNTRVISLNWLRTYRALSGIHASEDHFPENGRRVAAVLHTAAQVQFSGVL